MIGIILFIIFGILDFTSADFRVEALKLTNSYRAKHGARPLVQDATANKVAQAYAEKLLKTCEMEHSQDEKYGENLYGGCGYWAPDPKKKGDMEKYAIDGTKSWYDEIKDYNFKKPGFGMDTGHFTAVVWKGTTSMGLGLATNGKDYPNGKAFLVANYNPSGNYEGQFPENVAPARG